MIVCISMFQGKFGRVDPGGIRFNTIANNSVNRRTTLYSVSLALLAKLRMQEHLSRTQRRLADDSIEEKDDIFLKEATINQLLQRCKPPPSLSH